MDKSSQLPSFVEEGVARKARLSEGSVKLACTMPSVVPST